MRGIGRWFIELFVSFNLWYAQFILGRKILLLNRSIDSGQHTLSFRLCHMILTSIPPSLIAAVTSKDARDASLTLRCSELLRIFKHLDECAEYLEVQAHNTGLKAGEHLKRYTPIGTRDYPYDWGEYSMGWLMAEHVPKLSTVELYEELLKRIGRIVNAVPDDVELHESVQSYFDRMSQVVLEDCYSLICKLVGLSLNARTQERPIKTGEGR